MGSRRAQQPVGIELAALGSSGTTLHQELVGAIGGSVSWRSITNRVGQSDAVRHAGLLELAGS